MAIRFIDNFKFKNLDWKSGYLYSFRYNAYRNDPEPLAILMGKYTGRHPNTGYQWNLLQMINLNYIPRSHRKIFGMQWQYEMERTNGNPLFTWKSVQRNFPYLRYGIRRYMVKPVYRIQNPIEIPLDQMEEAIISTFDKDFSKKVKLDLVKKFQRIKKNQKKQRKRTLGGLFGSKLGGLFGFGGK